MNLKKEMKNKNLIFSAIALATFAIISIIYCSPVLTGNSILQPDIVNYKGSSQEMKSFEEMTGDRIYWSNAMFGGMPTYQTGAKYANDFIKSVDHFFRFLPRPADYLFLLFSGFFILGIVLFKNWKYAFLGSIFFAMGAYYYIIIAAGHNAKVHSIAYFAPLVAGIILIYQRKYVLGFILTSLFMGLELSANHPQMTYYLFLVMLVYFIIELINAIKSKQILNFAKSTAFLIVACFIGIGLNATRIMSVYEYSKETTRGNTEMTLMQNNSKGLDYDYITHWSYGKLETFNLFIPNFMGGPTLTSDDQLKNYLAEVKKQQYVVDIDDDFDYQLLSHLISSPVSAYWGDQPGTSGPAYQGAVVVFLFFLGIFLVRNHWTRFKWWLLATTILSILLAWGKNFPVFTHFMIDNFPFYDKFRAVSSMLVMAEFTMPLLAILTVYVFFNDEYLTEDYKKKILIYAGGGVVALLLIFLLFGDNLFSFTNEYDALTKMQMMDLVKEYNPNKYGVWDGVFNNLENSLRQDRINLFKADTLRTLIFVLLTIALLLAFQLNYLKNKLIVVLGIATLAFVDGWGINKRYMNEDNFVDEMFVENPFPTQTSSKLMNEAQTNPHLRMLAYKVPLNKTLDSLKHADPTIYRVFDNVSNTFNDATTSYFHHAIGGYHGAKLRNFQDIIDLYISGNSKAKELGITSVDTEMILNLLNTKYLVHGSYSSPMVEKNKNAYGNVWLVSDIKWVQNANEEILAIKEVDLMKTAVLESKFNAQIANAFPSENTSTIELVNYLPHRLTYKANIKSPKLAVFSEIYYSKGWVAKVDGKERPILKTNYFLRGIPLEEGDNEIIMEFNPPTIRKGENITLAFNIVFLLIAFGAGFWYWKKGDFKKS